MLQCCFVINFIKLVHFPLLIIKISCVFGVVCNGFPLWICGVLTCLRCAETDVEVGCMYFLI